MRRALLAASALAGAGGAALAQQFELPPVAGPLITAEITQSFVADSNLFLDDPNPGTSYYADTRLLFGLLSETEDQTFALGFDTGLRALWEAEQDFDFTFASPSTATADYGREWASGALDAGVSYRQQDFNDRDLPDGENFTPDDLDQGQREVTEYRYDADVALALATDSPSSYELNFSATRFDYSDTGIDAVPRDTFRGDALWRLQVNPVLSAALFGSYVYFDSDNEENTNIRTGELDAGVIYEPSETLRIDAGLGYTRRRQEETLGGVRTTDEQDGPAVRAALRYAFEDITINAFGRYTQATEGRPLTGAISAAYPLPRGRITGRVFQRNTGGSAGDEVQVTGVGIGLLRELNTVSALQFDFAAARQTDVTAPFEPDIDRLSFTAAYSYALTEVVSANLGYRYRSFDQNPDDATSNAVFVEIGRSFSTQP
jgi:opacity protein-like surface antigen